ncbi:hypothetical protein ACGFZ6_02270 [Stutzerimonas stutzeri]|uniref:hypothetical protein n=1 Tax=Stutzerimonas stutzeri TaxID=316 RepID=UPI00371CF99C
MSHVLCNRCKRLMIPRVIFSRSVAGRWGWRIGGGNPISNCCPFCLSEHWNAAIEPSPLRGSNLMRLLSIPLTLIMLSLILGAFSEVSDYLGGSAIVEWIGVIGAFVATYRFGRWFVN